MTRPITKLLIVTIVEIFGTFGGPSVNSIQVTDAELHRRTAAGDADALSELFRRRSPAVYRFALRMTGDPSVADEIVQETFSALIRNPHLYDPARAELVSYLFGAARNQLARRRAQAARDASVLDAGARESVDTTETPLDGLTRSERIETVRRAVLALPETYREAVALCDLGELSYAEAAEALGTAVGTVRSRLHRGRALLERKLALEPSLREVNS